MSTPLAFYLLPQVTWIPDAEWRRMEAAYALSFASCASDWSIAAPTVTLVSRAQDIPDAGAPMVFAPSIDQPGDLAYHTVLDGRPYSLILADQVQMSLADVQEAGGHEGDETTVDPDVDGYIILPDGTRVAKEVCDPGQNQRILLDLGEGDPIATSNHVTPAWFDRSSPPGTRLDAAGRLTQPLVVGPSGYAMIVTADGSTKQVGPGLIDAMRGVPGAFGPPAWKRHPAFRHGRRLADMHALASQIRRPT